MKVSVEVETESCIFPCISSVNGHGSLRPKAILWDIQVINVKSNFFNNLTNCDRDTKHGLNYKENVTQRTENELMSVNDQMVRTQDDTQEDKINNENKNNNNENDINQDNFGNIIKKSKQKNVSNNEKVQSKNEINGNNVDETIEMNDNQSKGQINNKNTERGNVFEKTKDKSEKVQDEFKIMDNNLKANREVKDNILNDTSKQVCLLKIKDTEEISLNKENKSKKETEQKLEKDNIPVVGQVAILENIEDKSKETAVMYQHKNSNADNKNNDDIPTINNQSNFGNIEDKDATEDNQNNYKKINEDKNKAAKQLNEMTSKRKINRNIIKKETTTGVYKENDEMFETSESQPDHPSTVNCEVDTGKLVIEIVENKTSSMVEDSSMNYEKSEENEIKNSMKTDENEYFDKSIVKNRALNGTLERNPQETKEQEKRVTSSIVSTDCQTTVMNDILHMNKKVDVISQECCADTNHIQSNEKKTIVNHEFTDRRATEVIKEENEEEITNSLQEVKNETTVQDSLSVTTTSTLEENNQNFITASLTNRCNISKKKNSLLMKNMFGRERKISRDGGYIVFDENVDDTNVQRFRLGEFDLERLIELGF